MKEISRRNFFTSLLPKFKGQENIVGTINEEPRLSFSRDVVQTVVLGPVSLFPVHTTCKMNLLNENFILQSFPEGIQLFDEKNKAVTKLSLGSDGQLHAHLGEHWPDNAVLSLFTGDIYNI